MSFIRELSWTYLAAAAVALAAILAAVRWWQGRHRGYGHSRSQSGHGPGSSRGAGYPSLQAEGYGTGAPVSGDQRALLTAANGVRDALDRQAREMGELRATWSRRLDDLERKIDALSRTQPQTRQNVPERRAEHGGYGGTYDSATYGAESLGSWPAATLEPAWSPGPGDQPVEVRDGVLVASRSLPPAGYLSATGSGQARVYLNADVQLTEFSLPKWAAFFDLQGAKPYAAYRTIRPAEVSWDEGAGRGELRNKGVAEAI